MRRWLISILIVLIVIGVVVIAGCKQQNNEPNISGLAYNVGEEVSFAQDFSLDNNFMDLNNLVALDSDEYFLSYVEGEDVDYDGDFILDIGDNRVHVGALTGTFSYVEGSSENQVVVPTSLSSNILEKGSFEALNRFFVDNDLGSLVDVSDKDSSIVGSGVDYVLSENKNAFDFEKISSTVIDKVKEEELIPVIIVMKKENDEESFYEQGLSKNQFSQKLAVFESKKSKVEARMVGKSRVEHDLKIINGVSAKVDLATLEELEKSDVVERVFYDEEVFIVLDESPEEIGATEIWSMAGPNDLPVTGEGVTIAILDTGVDYTHADLGGCFGPGCKVARGYDFVQDDDDPMLLPHVSFVPFRHSIQSSSISPLQLSSSSLHSS